MIGLCIGRGGGRKPYLPGLLTDMPMRLGTGVKGTRNNISPMDLTVDEKPGGDNTPQGLPPQQVRAHLISCQKDIQHNLALSSLACPFNELDFNSFNHGSSALHVGVTTASFFYKAMHSIPCPFPPAICLH